MADTKFTNGPFIIEPINNGHTYQVTTAGPDFRVVSETAEKADAVLQAAAPELYAKLLATRMWMDEDDLGPWEAAFCAEIDALLAKARGETHG